MRRWGPPNSYNNVDDKWSRPGRSGGKEVPPPPQLLASGPMRGPHPSGVNTLGRGSIGGRNTKGYSLVENDKFLATAVAASNCKSVLPTRKKKDYFDEESDEDLPYQPAPDSPTRTGAANSGSDDEEDPLDAFMSGIDSEVKRQEKEDKKKVAQVSADGKIEAEVVISGGSGKGQQPQAVRTDLEEEDVEESYYRYMQENPTAGLLPGEDLPEIEYDEEGNPIIEKKKHIDPLPPLDHKQIEYSPFERYFYNEHPEIAGLSNREGKSLRFKLGINASGTFVPNPVCSFAHFGFDERLLSVIRKSEYTQPTPIQAQAIPVALSGRDLIGIAKTGSGKTAAYLWPMIVHIMAQPQLRKLDGPIGLICAPTRELSLQIYSEAKKFGKAFGLRVVCAYGGGNKYEQCKALNEGAEIVVCTPGRLIDCIKASATNLKRVTLLVFDEADRMFDLGFGPQVRSIAGHVRPDRQALMFSATFKPKVENLAKVVLNNPVRIVQGEVGDANEDVTQHVKVFSSKEERFKWLSSCIVSFLASGQVLVFSTRKADAEDLAAQLKRRDFDCVLLHGDMHQYDRTEMITKFKQGHCRLMVATDVAARGLDIPSIKTVVNFDPARDMDTHVHRVGRTGRAGEKGDAYTLLQKPQDAFFASQLVQSLEASHQIVPQELIDLAMFSSKFRKGEGDKGFNAQKLHLGLGYATSSSSSKPSSRFSQDNDPSSSGQTVASARAALNQKVSPSAGILGSAGPRGPQSGRMSMMRSQFSKQFQSSFRSASSEDAESTSTIQNTPPTPPEETRSRSHKRESRWNNEQTDYYNQPKSSKPNYYNPEPPDCSSTPRKDNQESSMSRFQPDNLKYNDSKETSNCKDDDSKFKVPSLPLPSTVSQTNNGSQNYSEMNSSTVDSKPPPKKKSRWDVSLNFWWSYFVSGYSEAKKFGKAFGLRVVCAYGGGNKYEQCKALNEGAEIVVCTPGRLIDCIKASATNLKRVTLLVFDEADRMFDLGFGPQVRSIAGHVRPDRQALMFSATFKPKVENLAKVVLNNPVRIVQGEVGDANEDVTQHVKVFSSKEERFKWLSSCIVSFLASGQVLVFSTRKADAEDLAAQLKRRDFDCVLLHGDMHQYDRTEMITKFKQGHCRLMVATDVAARGLDIPSIKTVVNFDPARDMDTHVHRVGRTGRAGEKGDAYTLLQKSQDAFFASQLVQSLEASHQIVPQELIDLAMFSSKFRKGEGDKGFNAQKLHLGLGYATSSSSSKPSSRFSQDNDPSSSGQTVASARAALNQKVSPSAGILGSAGPRGPQSGRMSMMRSQFSKQFQSSFRSASSEDAESTSTIQNTPPTPPEETRSRSHKRESRWNNEQTDYYNQPKSSKPNYYNPEPPDCSSTPRKDNQESSMTRFQPDNLKYNDSKETSNCKDDDSKFKVPSLPLPSTVSQTNNGSQNYSEMNSSTVDSKPPPKKKSRWDVC
ncbi:uncharacterized protein LOC134841057 [Symsagittifera roscoffensis]|uniref:uncharacterized protein LOC134841057 n=1 Tax=Symsagittifera roscoffensis TaxID=84072 RepID=UPI00307B9407